MAVFCRTCGTQNDDNNYRCTGCGNELHSSASPATQQPYPPPYAYPPGTIPNYLVQAILATVFCCLPAGIVAIVFAAQVNGQVAAGNIEGALQSSKNAKLWSWVSFGAGLAVVVVYIAIAAITVAAETGF